MEVLSLKYTCLQHLKMNYSYGQRLEYNPELC